SAHPQQAVGPETLDLRDLSHAVDVTQNQVPIELVREPERFLEVDLAFAVESCGHPQGLVRNVDAEALLAALHHGQAGAVDRDAVTDGDVAQTELSRVDRQAQPIPGPLDHADPADCRYDAAEHGQEF